MSFIFEALKKAERERRAGTDPRPALATPPEEFQGHARRSWPLLAGACAAAVVAAGAVWLSLRAPASTSTSSPETVLAPPTDRLPAAPASEAPSVPSAPEEPVSQAPAPAPLPGSSAAPPDPSGGEARTLSLAPSAPPPPPPESAPAPQEPAAPVPAPAPPPTVVPAARAPATPPAREAAPSAPRASGPLPLLRELPPEVRERIGRLEISGHVYGEAPAERFVFLNGRAVRAGEAITAGVTLEAVTPDGIVIDYGEGRARVEAAP